MRVLPGLLLHQDGLSVDTRTTTASAPNALVVHLYMNYLTNDAGQCHRWMELTALGLSDASATNFCRRI